MYEVISRARSWANLDTIQYRYIYHKLIYVVLYYYACTLKKKTKKHGAYIIAYNFYLGADFQLFPRGWFRLYDRKNNLFFSFTLHFIVAFFLISFIRLYPCSNLYRFFNCRFNTLKHEIYNSRYELLCTMNNDSWILKKFRNGTKRPTLLYPGK